MTTATINRILSDHWTLTDAGEALVNEARFLLDDDELTVTLNGDDVDKGVYGRVMGAAMADDQERCEGWEEAFAESDNVTNFGDMD